MNKKISKKKSGFSLIELSIVLIIIGLLIAGITGGASLIKSSELRTIMSEARAYAVSVNAFYTQFNAYPGDYGTSVGGVSTALGDADGTIEYYSSATPSGGTKSEGAAAWIHLRYSGIIDNLPASISLIDVSSAAPTFGSSSTSGANAPISKVKSAGWHFDYRTITEGSVNAAANQNVLVYTGTGVITTSASASNTLVNGSNLIAGALIGSDALSIDAKLDDGYANSGKIRGVGVNSNGSSCYSASTSANVTYTTTSATSKVCGFTYQVDINS